MVRPSLSFRHRLVNLLCRLPIRSLGLLVMLLLVLPVGSGCSRQESAPEVWIIGLDGADWDLLNPMMERGELPHLQKLRDEGSAGILRSFEPLLSPMIWTSIATGRSPAEHGVTWFMTESADGAKIPISSASRRVRAFWNIATENDIKSGVVGWWATWPADEVNGFMVSDYVGWHSFGITGREATADGLTWPPGLLTKALAALPAPTAIDNDLLATMVQLPPAELAYDPEAGIYDDPINHLRQAIATSRGYTDLVLQQLQEERPRVLAVYYEGTDAVMHLYGRYSPPRLPWVSKEDFTAYRNAVTSYWRWQDGLVGELLAQRSPQTTVIVVSDHGFRQGPERRKEETFDIDNADADHMIDGVIILNGPEIKSGAWIEGADVFDITPTLLYLLDLPVAEDMAGAPLEAAVRPEILTQRPPATIPTYETSPLVRGELDSGDEQARESMEQMLRSLGYISGGGDGDEAAGPAGSGNIEHVVNLATVLMHQGKYDEAVNALREALREQPDQPEVSLNLAQALARRGDVDEAVEIYRGLLAAAPNWLEAREDLSHCLGLAGRPEEALAVYDEGLAQEPSWVSGLAGKGNALLQLERTEAAEQVLRRAIAIDPSHHLAHRYLGITLAKRGDLVEAEQHLHQAMQIEPTDAGTAIELANLLETAGRPAEAIAMLKRVRQLSEPDGLLEMKLGALLMNAGKPEDALTHLLTGSRLRPGDADLLGNLGVAYAMTGKMPEAVDAFEQVVKIRPESVEAQTQLGIFYSQLDRAREAEKALQAAVAADPENMPAHLHLGILHHQAGRLGQAKTSYQTVLRLQPDLPLALYNLGMILGEEGDDAEARRLIDRARQLDPSLPPLEQR
jgi:tetratricopeptide (TPR) repeat protein